MALVPNLDLVVIKVGKTASTLSRESPMKYSDFEVVIDQAMIKLIWSETRTSGVCQSRINHLPEGNFGSEYRFGSR